MWGDRITIKKNVKDVLKRNLKYLPDIFFHNYIRLRVNDHGAPQIPFRYYITKSMSLLT